jgi:hypothetical protein
LRLRLWKSEWERAWKSTFKTGCMYVCVLNPRKKKLWSMPAAA